MRVYLTNFGYHLDGEFASVDAALAYGKSKGFEFSVWQGAELLATWSPIGGTRYFN